MSGSLNLLLVARIKRWTLTTIQTEHPNVTCVRLRLERTRTIVRGYLDVDVEPERCVSFELKWLDDALRHNRPEKVLQKISRGKQELGRAG